MSNNSKKKEKENETGNTKEENFIQNLIKLEHEEMEKMMGHIEKYITEKNLQNMMN